MLLKIFHLFGLSAFYLICYLVSALAGLTVQWFLFLHSFWYHSPEVPALHMAVVTLVWNCFCFFFDSLFSLISLLNWLPLMQSHRLLSSTNHWLVALIVFSNALVHKSLHGLIQFNSNLFTVVDFRPVFEAPSYSRMTFLAFLLPWISLVTINWL